jgi:hypothetical protein
VGGGICLWPQLLRRERKKVYSPRQVQEKAKEILFEKETKS